jgi:AcrR family transcriptional regulator
LCELTLRGAFRLAISGPRFEGGDRVIAHISADPVIHPDRAVREQFWNAGYAATSLDDLTRVSGLGKGSLYAAFGDKHQLFLLALRSYNDANDRALRKLLESAPRAVDALRAFVIAPVGDASGAAAHRGCFMANSACELAAADPELLAEARRTYAQGEGDLPPDADPIETARALLAAQQGVVVMGRTGLDITTLTAEP